MSPLRRRPVGEIAQVRSGIRPPIMRAGSKQTNVIALLRRPQGTTIAAIMRGTAAQDEVDPARGVIVMAAPASELEDEIADVRDLDLPGLLWHSVFRRKAPDHLGWRRRWESSPAARRGAQ